MSKPTLTVLGVRNGKYVKTATFDVSDEVKDYLISKIRDVPPSKKEEYLKLNDTDRRVQDYYEIQQEDIDLYMVLAIKYASKALNTQRVQALLGHVKSHGLSDVYIVKEDFLVLRRFAKHLFENPNLQVKDIEIPDEVKEIFKKIVQIKLIDSLNTGLHNKLGELYLPDDASYEDYQRVSSILRKAYVMPKSFYIPKEVLNTLIFNEAIALYKSARRIRKILSNKVPNDRGIIYFDSLEDIPRFIKENISEHVAKVLLSSARRKTRNVKSAETILRKVFDLDPSRIFPDGYTDGVDVYAVDNYSIKPFGYNNYSGRRMLLTLKTITGLDGNNPLLEFNVESKVLSGQLLEVMQNIYDVKLEFPSKASKISKSIRSIRFENIHRTPGKTYYEPVHIVLHSELDNKEVTITFDVHVTLSANSTAAVNAPFSLLYYIKPVL